MLNYHNQQVFLYITVSSCPHLIELNNGNHGRGWWVRRTMVGFSTMDYSIERRITNVEETCNTSFFDLIELHSKKAIVRIENNHY